MKRGRKRRRDYQLIVVLDAVDRAALKAVAEYEKSTLSDVVRRLVRRRAGQITSRKSARSHAVGE